MRWYSVFVVAILSAAAGCGGVHNTPQNVPLAGAGLVSADPNAGGSPVLDKATIVKTGKLTEYFSYLKNYAEGTSSSTI